jgi:hypothetical protein
MVLAYTIIGAMLAGRIHWDRVEALAAIYFLTLGIGAHALAAIGQAKLVGFASSNLEIFLLQFNADHPAVRKLFGIASEEMPTPILTFRS